MCLIGAAPVVHERRKGPHVEATLRLKYLTLMLKCIVIVVLHYCGTCGPTVTMENFVIARTQIYGKPWAMRTSRTDASYQCSMYTEFEDLHGEVSLCTFYVFLIIVN